MRGLIAAGLALFLSGCSSTSAEERDPFYLHIAIGRWSHMVSQIADLTAHPYDPAETDEEVTDPAALARRLREVVWGYNLQRAALCAEGRFVAISCGASYAPPWLNERPDRPPGARLLAQRSRNVGERIMPLWAAVCDEARARVSDPEEQRLICAIE